MQTPREMTHVSVLLCLRGEACGTARVRVRAAREGGVCPLPDVCSGLRQPRPPRPLSQRSHRYLPFPRRLEDVHDAWCNSLGLSEAWVKRSRCSADGRGK